MTALLIVQLIGIAAALVSVGFALRSMQLSRKRVRYAKEAARQAYESLDRIPADAVERLIRSLAGIQGLEHDVRMAHEEIGDALAVVIEQWRPAGSPPDFRGSYMRGGS